MSTEAPIAAGPATGPATGQIATELNGSATTGQNGGQNAKITLYWLEKSRAHRILWLLEELKLDYELVTFKRTKEMLAPKELKDIHPLGKSPVLSVQAPNEPKPRVIAESAFIVEYLLDHYGKDLIPQRYTPGLEGKVGEETEEWMRYRYYMHYAEGSIMPLMVFAVIMNQIRNAPVPFFIKPITRQIANRVDDSFLNRNFKTHVAFLEDQLSTGPGTGEWFCGSKLSGADIMMIFPLEAGQSRAGISAEKTPKLAAWIKRVHERDAYKRAITKIEDVTGAPFEAKL